MADQDIKDFTVGWILFGVIIFALSTFALTFSFNNNPLALGQSTSQLELISQNFSSTLTEIEGNYDTQMNVSAELNSEESSIGTASASSTSYSFMGTSSNVWTQSKIFIYWVFAGSFGNFILAIIGGLVGLVGLYYIIKLIRSIL